MRTRIVFVLAVGLLSSMCVSASAHADEGRHPFRAGFGIDLGVPSGLAAGFVMHPKEDWATMELSLTHNLLSFGGRASVKLDPLALMPRLPIGLFVDVQAGFAGRGNIPSHANLPAIGYDYLNAYGGLRFGKSNNFHWNFEVGPSYLHVNTDRFQSLLSHNSGGLVVGNPVVNGWIFPTVETGFEVVWP